MIDFQKTKVNGVNPELWLNHNELSFKGEFDNKTSVIADKIVASYKGLKFLIYFDKLEPCRVNSMWIHGSLHKYYNFLNSVTGPNQWNDILRAKGYNGNDFTFNGFNVVLDDLEDRFGICFQQSSLHGFEYGLNCKNGPDTSAVLDSLIMHNGTLFDIKRSNFQYSKRAEKGQMILKAYDKALQYGELERIFRFEKKVSKMECIQHLGINSLNDLRNINNWNALYNDLLKTWDSILFVDHLMPTVDLCLTERIMLEEFKQGSFWKAVQSNRRNTPKTQYKAIELKCNGQLKQSVRSCLRSAYFNLTSSVSVDHSNKWSNITPLRIIELHYGLGLAG